MWMRIGKKEEEEECSFVFALCCFMCNTDVCSLSLSLSLSLLHVATGPATGRYGEPRAPC